MPNLFSGHSPISQPVINKKLRIAQAKLNVVTNRLVRIAQTFGSKKRNIEKTQRIICMAPGRPKLVAPLFRPVIVVFIDIIYTQGTKQQAINATAARIPM